MNTNINIMDNIFESLIANAVPIAAENVVNNMPEPEEHTFSEEYQRKIKKLFAQERNKVRRKKMSKYLVRAAAVFLILTTAATITITSVEAWRIRFMNFVIDLRDDHTIIEFREEEAPDTFESDELYLGYIPDGFRFKSSTVGDDLLSVIFVNDDLWFRINIRDITDTMAIDTEDANVRRLKVDCNDAFLSTMEDMNVLVWHDNINAYEVSGNIDENILIKIAEGLEVKQ